MEQVHQNKTVLAFWKISNGLNGKINKGRKRQNWKCFYRNRLRKSSKWRMRFHQDAKTILSQALNTCSVQNTHVHPALRHLRMKCCHHKIINSLPQSYSHSTMTCTQPHPSPQQHRLWTRTTDGHSWSPWELLTGRTTQRKLHATSPPSL